MAPGINTHFSLPRRPAHLLLALVLILSQALSLVHATEHVFEPGQYHCAICNLRDHQENTAVITAGTACVVEKPFAASHYRTCKPATPTLTTATIRAPPYSS